MGFVIGFLIGIIVTAALVAGLVRYGLPLAIIRGWIR